MNEICEVTPVILFGYSRVSGSSSAVERQLPKLDVAGSIPVSRSIFRARRTPRSLYPIAKSFSEVISWLNRLMKNSKPVCPNSKNKVARRTGSLEFRVSEKGGVSVYGLGRFP